ncbi:unnamed protein product [Heterosigma akashiwo]
MRTEMQAPPRPPPALACAEIELLALNAEGNQAAALRATDEKDRLAKLRAGARRRRRPRPRPRRKGRPARRPPRRSSNPSCRQRAARGKAAVKRKSSSVVGWAARPPCFLQQ